MNTNKKLSAGEMSSALFEIGLALKLRKIDIEKIERLFPVSNINKAISEIENDEIDKWDSSHISKGGILRAALEALEISQAELARRMGVPNQKVNDLIKGRIALTTTWAKKIGETLNVSYKNFL